MPNAIDPILLEDPGEEEIERVRERYQIRGRFVLYAGNIKPHKNLDRLIAAFGLLKQRPAHEDVKLLDHRRRDQPVRLAAPRVESAGVRQDVRFFGFVPDRRWRRSIAWRRSSRSRRCTRASACRRSRRWPAARRS